MPTVLALAAVMSLTFAPACNGDAGRAGFGGAPNAGGENAVGGQSGGGHSAGSSPGGGAGASGGEAGAAADGGKAAASGAAGSAAIGGASGGAGPECPTESPAKKPSVCTTAQQGKLCKYADSCFFCGCMPQQAGMYCAYGSGDCPQ